MQRRAPTSEEVLQDFAAEPGIPNVGIVCGSVSSLAVVDVDGPEAETKVQALDLPRTLTVKTARGAHYYFRTSDRVSTRKLTLVDGNALELRGEGAYVLAPPSVHPDGPRYAFEDPSVPIVELPTSVMVVFTVTSMNGSGQDEPEEVPPLPERWLNLVSTNSRVRAAWEGRAGDHRDQTGSGKDMRLAHEVRRCGFGPEEARRILAAAPYPVGGGRPADYLDRTIARAYQAKHKRHVPAYGAVPVAVVESAAFSSLTPAAKALYLVLCARRMRPSGAVLRNANHLAKEAGIHPKTLGGAAAQLVRAGLITRKRVAGGRMLYHVLLGSPPAQTGVREAVAKANVPEGQDPPDRPPATPPSQTGVSKNSSPPSQTGVRGSLVHEIGGSLIPAPAEPLPKGEPEGEDLNPWE